MHGITLGSLPSELTCVPPEHNERPAATIEDPFARLPRFWRWEMRERYDEPSFFEHYHSLPLEAFQSFSFDELCKLRYSSTYMMDRTVQDLFEKSPPHEVVRKIESSMWQWGGGDKCWNEVVEAYHLLRDFRIPDALGAELRLDHSTYWNERGFSKYNRTFLDGIFGLLFFYKGVHVYTIGFSLMRNRRILVQQLQSPTRNGNRFLFKLPQNRLEFALDLLRENFPGYAFSVISGKDLAERTLADYRRGLELAQLRLGRERRQARLTEEELNENALECTLLESKIRHLESELPRLVSLYGNGGRHRLGRKRNVKNLDHYDVHLA